MRFRKQLLSLAASFLVVGFLAQPLLAADKYEIDSVHSNIGFSVKHLMVSTVLGHFNDYTGAIEFDKSDDAAFKADVTIQTQSIDTNNENRDKHLRNADFFDAEKYPTITFQSKKLTAAGDGYEIVGDLTMHGVTKEITIPVTIAGPVKGPSGADVIGLSGTTTINRQDFGISWNKGLDSGGLVVEDNVKLIIDIEAHKK